jgi:hypothetical protein
MMGSIRRDGQARKRCLKQARKIPESDILEFLTHDNTSLANYFIHDEMLCYWEPICSPLVMTIDDEPLAVATMTYLGQIGVPHISGDEELENLIRQKRWTRFPS